MEVDVLGADIMGEKWEGNFLISKWILMRSKMHLLPLAKLQKSVVSLSCGPAVNVDTVGLRW